MKIWVTGAGGLIGNYLVQFLKREQTDVAVFAPVRRDLDLTDFSAVETTFRSVRPDAIVHCAAMSKTPDCQANPALARKANVEATAVLAGLAHDVPFVFCSTDLVFDGQKGNYVETDVPNPLSIYAETKVAAEAEVRKSGRHTIARISLNYGHSIEGNRSFNEEMVRALAAGKECRLFVDEYRCPIPAAVTARALWELVQKRASGTFHLSGAERLSRFQIGELLTEGTPEYTKLLRATSLKEYKGAPRPPDVSLNCAKLQEILSFPLPKFSEWIGAEKHSRR